MSNGRAPFSGKFQRTVRDRRKQLKLTQEEVARRMGYRSSEMISQIENGRKRPMVTKVRKYAFALKLNGTKLLDLYFRDFND